MFKSDTLGSLVLIFLIAVVLGQPVLAWLLGVLFVTLICANRWSSWALRRLHYERSLSQTRAFVGDTVTVTFRVANPKLLSVPSLLCADEVASRFDYQAELLPSTKPNIKIIERHVALRPYEAVSWKVALRCTERGLHAFGPAVLTASDPFGLHASTAEFGGQTRLLVYPELVALPNFVLTPRQPLGDRRATRQLLTDPARTVSVRDYRPTDPFKTIHWGATARRGELQTRVFEPTSTLELVIVLDLDTFELYWQGILPDLIEYLISVAATVATAAEQGQWSFGLYTNAGPVDSEQLTRIAPSRSPAQLGLVLEALAKLVPYSLVGLPLLLRRLGPELPWGATILVISAVPSMELQTALLRLHERGRRVRWLYGGAAPPPVVPGVEVERLPVDASWRAAQLTQISAS